MKSVWIVFFSSILAVYASPKCDNDMFQACDVGMSNNGYLPETGADFKLQCSLKRKTFSCAVDVLQRCWGDKQYYIDFNIALVKLVDRVCDGDLSESYLRASKCFYAIPHSSLEEVCEEKLRNVKYGDTNYVTFDECLGSVVKDTCGEESYDVFLEVYKVLKMGKDL